MMRYLIFLLTLLSAPMMAYAQCDVRLPSDEFLRCQQQQQQLDRIERNTSSSPQTPSPDQAAEEFGASLGRALATAAAARQRREEMRHQLEETARQDDETMEYLVGNTHDLVLACIEREISGQLRPGANVNRVARAARSACAESVRYYCMIESVSMFTPQWGQSDSEIRAVRRDQDSARRQCESQWTHLEYYRTRTEALIEDLITQ